MPDCTFAHLLVVAHEALKRLEREAPLAKRTKFLVETLHFWSRFQQLNKAFEVVKIQESTPLHISLLQCPSARRKTEDKRGHIPGSDDTGRPAMS
jgi:hypothetical protein